MVVVREELWMVMKMKDLRLDDAFALHYSARPSARVWPKVFNARLLQILRHPFVIFSVPDRFSSSNVHRSESQTSPDLSLLPRSESFSNGKPITANTPPCIVLRPSGQSLIHHWSISTVSGRAKDERKDERK